MTNRSLRLVLATLGFFGSGALGATAEPTAPKVPKSALRQVVSKDVTLFHWRETAPGSRQSRVRAYARIAKWPEKAWGAELTLTPIPFCCGAKKKTIRWRKSQAARLRTLGAIDASEAYKLAFRFR